MIKTFSLVSAFILSLNVGPALAADDVITWKDDVKGWYIGVDTTTGDLGDGCFMVTEYEGNTFLRLQIDPNFGNNFAVYVGDREWKSLEPGKFYPLEIIIGNQEPWVAEAEAIEWNDTTNALVFHLSTEDDKAAVFVEEFMRYLGIEFFYENQSIANLTLEGTYAATSELFECALEMNDLNASGGDDPFNIDRRDKNDPFS